MEETRNYSRRRFLSNKDLKTILNIGFIGFILFIAVGCQSNRQLTKKNQTGRKNGNAALTSILDQKSHEFNTLKIRNAHVAIDINGVQNSTKTNIAIYRDSLLVVSIIPILGYEALRIICSEDSIIVVNRMNKSYYSSSLESYILKYNIPIGFKDLLAILLNEVFYYKSGLSDRTYEDKLSSKDDKIFFVINSFRNGTRVANQGLKIDRDASWLESLVVIDYETKMRLSLDYVKFLPAGKFDFPQKILLDLTDDRNTIKVNINYGQVVFDESINVDIAVPKNYIFREI